MALQKNQLKRDLRIFIMSRSKSIGLLTLPFQVRYGSPQSKQGTLSSDQVEVSSSQGEVKTDNSFSDRIENILSIKTDHEFPPAIEGTFSLGKRIGRQLWTNNQVSPASQDAAKEFLEGTTMVGTGYAVRTLAKKKGGNPVIVKTGDLAAALGALKIKKAGNDSYKRLDKNGDLREIEERPSDGPKHLANSPMEEETVETVFLLALSTVSMVFSLIVENAPDGAGLFTGLYLFFVISIFTILHYLYENIFLILAKIFFKTKKNEEEKSSNK
jgi:hypothetical protein